MTGSIEHKGSVYVAEIEPKKPFRVTLHREAPIKTHAGTMKHEACEQHYGHWDGTIVFDPNKYNDLNVEVGTNSDGTKHAILPWPEGVYQALEVALKLKLLARRAKQ